MAQASPKIPFNNQVLRWARERRRIATEDAARRAAVTPEKIVEWEQGSASPTVRQARDLAALYDRPFLEFFAAAPPELAPPELAPDFRFLKRGPTAAEAMALEGVQEWAETQRLNAIDLYDGMGEAPPLFPLSLRASIEAGPEEVAEATRETIKFPIEVQLKLKAAERRLFPTILRNVIEDTGVLVLKQSDLSKTRTRGICLYEDVLPIIVFGNESPGGQAFTLAHEFGHVLIGKSAISGAPIVARRGSGQRKVEGWCNSFAAAFLMPEKALKSHPCAPSSRVERISTDALKTLSDAFAVSRHAMLIRLVTLGLVDPRFYWRVKRPEFEREEAEFEGQGRSKYYGTRFRNQLGDHYTALVLESLETGRIGVHSAAEFMGIKNARHLTDIRDNFGS